MAAAPPPEQTEPPTPEQMDPSLPEQMEPPTPEQMDPPLPEQMEPQPHPVKDQLPGVSYCMTSPPSWGEAIVLGFQHYIVMLGTSVLIPTALVPQMGGGNEEKARVIQTLLFVAGVNTLLQTLLGARLPAVIGGSHTFVSPTLSIILASRYSEIDDPHEKFVRIMRGTQGALIAASTIQIILGFSGLWRLVVRLLSPLSATPLVALVGFGLYELGFPCVAKCIEIGLPQIVLLIILTEYIRAHHLHFSYNTAFFLQRYAIITSIAVVWLYAFFLTVGGAYKSAAPKTRLHCRTDQSGLVWGAPWFSVPYPFQWGVPTFHAGEACAMMAASFVALVESTGALVAISRYASATPCPPSVMSRGIGWQGVGILLDGLFGTANGSSVSVENIGCLALTRVGSRRVVQISALFMIIFSVLGKFGAVLASIPGPIVAANYCFLAAYAGSGGIDFLQFCNLDSFRTKFILGFSLFMGLSVPHYLKDYNTTSVAGHGPVHTHLTWVNDMINVVLSSRAFVGGVVAYLLDNTLDRNDNTVRKDRGQHFWERFRSFRTDARSEEFYSLPCHLSISWPGIDGLRKCFPSY